MQSDDNMAKFCELSGVSGGEAEATASMFLTLAEGDVGGALDLFFDSFQGAPDFVTVESASTPQQDVAKRMNCSMVDAEGHIKALVLKTSCSFDEAGSLLNETASVDDAFDLWADRRLVQFRRDLNNEIENKNENKQQTWARLEARKADEIDHSMKRHFAKTRNEKLLSLMKEKLLLHQLTELMSDNHDFLATMVVELMPTILLACRRDDEGNLKYPLQHSGRRCRASEETWEAEQEHYRHILKREKFDQANWETLLNNQQMLEEALESTIVLWLGGFIESGNTPPADEELFSTFVQDRTGIAFATEAAVFEFLGREPTCDPPLGSLEKTTSSELLRVRSMLPSWQPFGSDKRRCCRSDHMAVVFRAEVPSSRAGRILHLERDFKMHGVAVQKPDGEVQYLSMPQAITMESGDWLWFGFMDSRCAIWHEQCCSFVGDDATSKIGMARLPLYEIEMPDDPKWRGKTVADLQESGINMLGLLLPHQQSEPIWHPAIDAGIETGSRMLVLPSQVSKLTSKLGFQGVRVQREPERDLQHVADVVARSHSQMPLAIPSQRQALVGVSGSHVANSDASSNGRLHVCDGIAACLSGVMRCFVL